MDRSGKSLRRDDNVSHDEKRKPGWNEAPGPDDHASCDPPRGRSDDVVRQRVNDALRRHDCQSLR